MNVERTASNLIGQLPNRHEVLAALGLETRRSVSADVIQALGFVAAGAIVGASLAILLTPKSGPQMRSELRERVMDALPTHSSDDAATGGAESRTESATHPSNGGHRIGANVS